MADPGDVDARIHRLREAYGQFPVETETYDHPTDEYARARDLHERGIPGGARVWVEREVGPRDRQTLLVRTAYRPDAWGVAGGLIEPDERADRAGEREVREETNVTCEVVDVAYVHRATRRHASGDRPSFEELGVAFVAEYDGGTPWAQDGEIRAVAWFDELPDAVYDPAARIGADRL